MLYDLHTTRQQITHYRSLYSISAPSVTAIYWPVCSGRRRYKLATLLLRGLHRLTGTRTLQDKKHCSVWFFYCIRVNGVSTLSGICNTPPYQKITRTLGNLDVRLLLDGTPHFSFSFKVKYKFCIYWKIFFSQINAAS